MSRFKTSRALLPVATALCLACPADPGAGPDDDTDTDSTGDESASASASDDTDSTDESGETDDDGCEALTCEGEGLNCGTVFDGCGDTIECGECDYPAECGFEVPNVCGCEEGAWQVEHVAFMEDVGLFTSVIVDDVDDVHVVYIDATMANLEYATRTADDGMWTTQTLDEDASIVNLVRMVQDEDGALHVVYNSGTGAIRYAKKPANGDWAMEDVVAGNESGTGLSLAVDAGGTVHMSYISGYSPLTARYTYGTAGAWTHELAGPAGNLSPQGETSIAVGPDPGEVHIAYSGMSRHFQSGDLQWRRLLYAHRATNGSWTDAAIEGEDPNGVLFVGYHPSLELDATGRIHILHYAVDAEDLRYATSDKPVTGPWDLELVDDEGSVGRWPSLEVDEFGTLHASYYDFTNEVLKEASKPLDGAWSTRVLTEGTGTPNEAEVGQYSSLFVESSLERHVTYYEGGADDLYYAWLPECGL